MLQQPLDFRDESEAPYRVLAELPEADLERTTRFKAWRIHDVVSHLHAWDWAAERFEDFLAKTLSEMAKGRRVRAVEADWLDDRRGRA